MSACAARTGPRELLDRALEMDEGRAFLSVVVERLGDLFEPRSVRRVRGCSLR